MSGQPPLVAGLELGGTKSVALLARGTDILDMIQTPTTTPDATLATLVDQLALWTSGGAVEALGVGSFGPLDLNPRSPMFGSITQTPKPGWSGTALHAPLAARFGLPIGIDTDVAGAAMAEARWGAASGCRVHVYLTVGTGIGGGVVVDGRPVHGLVHPEIGHIRVRRRPGDDFPGICPFHGDCLEGLASGPAIAARAGAPGAALAPSHPVWPLVADALAEAIAGLMLTLSAERVLIGGGVMQGQDWLLPMIRERVARSLNGYVAGLDALALERIVRAPQLGDRAGPLGAIALAEAALPTTPFSASS
jgi:fructokinase